MIESRSATPITLKVERQPSPQSVPVHMILDARREHVATVVAGEPLALLFAASPQIHARARALLALIDSPCRCDGGGPCSRCQAKADLAALVDAIDLPN